MVRFGVLPCRGWCAAVWIFRQFGSYGWPAVVGKGGDHAERQCVQGVWPSAMCHLTGDGLLAVCRRMVSGSFGVVFGESPAAHGL